MGTVVINQKTYNVSGSNNIVISRDGTLTIDGVVQHKEEAKTINIGIFGDVNEVSIENAYMVQLTKNITGGVSVTNGDITAQEIGGSVSTVNGNVKCGDVKGGVRTVNGDIKHNKQ